MLRPLILLAMLAPAAWGQAPPPIAPPVKPNPVATAVVPAGPLYAGDLIVLDGSASVGDAVDWELISPPDVTTYVVDSNGKTVAFANKMPGTYVFRIEAESVINGVIVKSKKRVSFTTANPAPVPVPAPVVPPVTPPAPAPDPAAGPLNAVLVYDSQADPDSTASVRSAATVDALVPLSTAFFVVDRATNPALAASYLARAGSGGSYPFVAVLTPSWKVVATAAAPTSPADVVAVVKKARGH